MLAERQVWVFNGTSGRFPGGVFSSRSAAESWIAQHGLSGILTAYPLDEGVFDWALRNNLVSDAQRSSANDDAFVGSFSTASQEHFHYARGALDH